MTVAVARNPYATNVSGSLIAAAGRLGVPVRPVDLPSLRLGIGPLGEEAVTDSAGRVAADSLAPYLLFGFPAAVHALRALARTTHAQNPVDGVLLADDKAAAAYRLARAGVPQVRTEICPFDAGQVTAVAAEIGYPVVVKTDEPGIAHKSDVGGVRLGLAGPAAAGAAYDDLARRLGPRVMVCETAGPGTALALGIVTDPALGPLLVIGAGGVLVEIMAERAVLLAPVTRSAAMAALARLRIAPVLAGSRGQPAADLGAVADAITGLSRLACDLGDTLGALDINPLICTPSGAIAVDALLVPRTA